MYSRKLKVHSDYWVFGFFPSSGILKNTTLRKVDLLPFSIDGVGDTYSVVSVTLSSD
jgi:hypothetical protein